MSAHGENRRNLQDAVSVNTADRIFDELRRNGAYKSWSDLADRVTGIGVKKIKKMQAKLFDVRPSTRKLSDHGWGEIHCPIRPPKIRDGNVGIKKDRVWRHRGGVDLYTERKKRSVENDDPQVDHVWECQLLDHANERTWYNDTERFTRSRTKNAHDELKALMNSHHNLNVTTRKVNLTKKDPITAWLKDRGEGKELDDYWRKYPYLRDNDKYWANITRAIVNTYNDLSKEAYDTPWGGAVLEEMNLMLDEMGV